LGLFIFLLKPFKPFSGRLVTMVDAFFDPISPGKVEFSPGKVEFSPGKVEFSPGKVEFSPGKVD